MYPAIPPLRLFELYLSTTFVDDPMFGCVTFFSVFFALLTVFVQNEAYIEGAGTGALSVGKIMNQITRLRLLHQSLNILSANMYNGENFEGLNGVRSETPELSQQFFIWHVAEAFHQRVVRR